MDLISGYWNDKRVKEAIRSPVLRGLVAFGESIRNYVPTSVLERFLELRMLEHFYARCNDDEYYRPDVRVLRNQCSDEIVNIATSFPSVWSASDDCFAVFLNYNYDEGAHDRSVALRTRIPWAS